MISRWVRQVFLRLGCLALVLAVLFPSTAGAMDDPLGVWVIGDGKARIRLENCEAGLCGTIIWLAEPLDPKTGQPKQDVHNSNAALRARPIIGTTILTLKPDGNEHWSGTIYNAQDGRTYDSTLKIDGENLALKGCVLDMLCKTQSWVRYKQ